MLIITAGLNATVSNKISQGPLHTVILAYMSIAGPGRHYAGLCWRKGARLRLSAPLFIPKVVMSAAQPHEIGTVPARRSAWLRLARPHQWSKNLLLLAPLIFSRHLFIARDAAIASAATVAFCALASFAYVLNDIYDRDADRLNPEKRNRPIAAGELSVGSAARFATALAAFGVALSLVIGRAFLLIALVYLLLQFAYSLWAKKIVIL